MDLHFIYENKYANIPDDKKEYTTESKLITSSVDEELPIRIVNLRQEEGYMAEFLGVFNTGERCYSYIEAVCKDIPT